MTKPAAPSTIHNPSSGGIIPSSWGDAVNDALDWEMNNKPHCRASWGAAQSVSTGTTTALTLFTVESYDVGGLHSTSTNPSRMTAPDTTLYSIGAWVSFGAHATGYRRVYLRVNGTTIIADDRNNGISGVTADIVLCTDYILNAGDYVEVVVFQTSGTSLNVTADFWMKSER